MEKINKCPFFGENEDLFCCYHLFESTHFVECQRCQARGQKVRRILFGVVQFNEDEAIKLAIEKWNYSKNINNKD